MPRNFSKGKTIAFSLAIITILSAFDQFLKCLVVNNLKPIKSIVLIKGFLGLNYVENDGAMMGLLGGRVVLLAVVSSVILIGLIVLIALGKVKVGVYYFCLIAIISGGVGNIIDRIFRGFVVDYIEFLFVRFYVFNFADMLITCSCFFLVFYEIYSAIIERRKRSKND